MFRWSFSMRKRLTVALSSLLSCCFETEHLSWLVSWSSFDFLLTMEVVECRFHTAELTAEFFDSSPVC